MQKAKKPAGTHNAEQQLLRLTIQLDELHPRIDALEADLKVVTASLTELLAKLTQSVNDRMKSLEKMTAERTKKLDERIEFWGECLQPQIEAVRAELPVLESMFMRHVHALEAENEKRKQQQREYSKFLGEMTE